METTGTGLPSNVGGRYTLGELIGRGGAADVYRARDELLGRDVAVKMFIVGGEAVPDGASGSPAGAADVPEDEVDGVEGAGDLEGVGADDAAPALVGDVEEGQEARHRREVLTLAGLSHPGLVTVYDVGDENGRAYFVMQLIEGDTLAQRIRASPLPIADVVALGAALGDALAYVHRRGVVHRDVKPGNVLLDGEGRAHLSDFGIAAVHDAAPVTAAGMVIGTASYLSPEQVRGEPIGAGVDVYALGLVLVECLTGRREYPGNALEAAVARLHRRPVVPAGLPAGLAALLHAMTADVPTERPSAEEVVSALRGVSREVGMDAETILSPVLMSAPTYAVGPFDPSADGPTALGPAVAVPGAAPAPTGASAASAPVGARRRTVAAVAASAVVLLAAGSAVGYAMLSQQDVVAPPPSATVAPAPPPPLNAIPSLTEPTVDEAEPATATRSRRTTTAPTTTTTTVQPRPTTTTVPPVVPPPPAPPVEETSDPPTPTSTTPPTSTTSTDPGRNAP